MTTTDTIQVLRFLRHDLTRELSSILDYWMKYTIDKEDGGFYGSVNNDNVPDRHAPKGIVLNSRILWAFSAAGCRQHNKSWIETATIAYDYIVKHFLDRKYGGVYWSVDKKGQVLDPRKQIYGLAFCIYGLSEYYRATGENMPLHIARALHEMIETYSLDKQYGGYLEAFTQGWKLKDDLRLSDKDDNEKKTMNTHLHVIEAYTNLYRVWPDQKLRSAIRNLLEVFENYFMRPDSPHLALFLDEKWTVKSTLVSYGHDIEASWLLLDCAKTIEDAPYIQSFGGHALQLAEATLSGLDSDGGLWYEYDPAAGRLIREKHSWPQAEAMIGFFNAYELTGDEKWLTHSVNSWEFIKEHICDKNNGEWFWGITNDYRPMEKEKAGFWKCPYHSSRACIELVKRVSALSPVS